MLALLLQWVPSLANVSRRALTMALMVAAPLMVCTLPLNRSISMPAVLLPAQEAWFYAPEESRVDAVHVKTGDHVQAGQVLVALTSPAISQHWKLAEFRYSLLLAKLNRMDVDEKNRGEYVAVKQELQSIFNEIAGLRKRLSALEIRAHIAGIVDDIPSGLEQGVWVGRENLLLHIRSTEGALLAGVVSERDSFRLVQKARGTFVPESGMGVAVEGHLSGVGTSADQGIELTYLVVADRGSDLLPVRFVVDGLAPDTAQRGTLTAEAQPRSLLQLAFGTIVSVFRREGAAHHSNG